MIYIIDNGESYSDHGIYFVDAPRDFEKWWKDEYLPWQESNYRSWKILGCAKSVDWWSGGCQTVDEFLKSELRRWEHDDNQRPLYMTEAAAKKGGGLQMTAR